MSKVEGRRGEGVRRRRSIAVDCYRLQSKAVEGSRTGQMERTGQGTRDAGGGRTFQRAYHGGREAVPAPEIRERLNACGGGGRGAT